MTLSNAVIFIFLFAGCALIGYVATAVGGIGGWWTAVASIAIIALLFADIELFYKRD